LTIGSNDFEDSGIDVLRVEGWAHSLPAGLKRCQKLFEHSVEVGKRPRSATGGGVAMEEFR
jgi:hypothetical protein